jgi:hypothetical protein
VDRPARRRHDDDSEPLRAQGGSEEMEAFPGTRCHGRTEPVPPLGGRRRRYGRACVRACRDHEQRCRRADRNAGTDPPGRPHPWMVPGSERSDTRHREDCNLTEVRLL